MTRYLACFSSGRLNAWRQINAEDPQQALSLTSSYLAQSALYPFDRDRPVEQISIHGETGLYAADRADRQARHRRQTRDPRDGGRGAGQALLAAGSLKNPLDQSVTRGLFKGTDFAATDVKRVSRRA